MFAGLAGKNLFRAERLPRNSIVRIHGLQAKPEFNGLLGTIVSYDKEKERYGVRIDINEQAPGGSCAATARDEGTAGSGAGTITAENVVEGAAGGKHRVQQPPVGSLNAVLAAAGATSSKRGLLRGRGGGAMSTKKHVDDYTTEQLNNISDADWSSILEDTSDEGMESSDGELKAEKKVRNARRQEKVDKKRAKRYGPKGNKYGLNMQFHGMPENNNPALEYPFETQEQGMPISVTAQNPVLIIGGVGHVDYDDGSNFTSQALLRSSTNWWKRNGCRFISFKHGESKRAARNIAAALESGKFKHVVLGDFSALHGKTLPEFVNGVVGPALAAFVKDFGGNVVTQSSRPDELLDSEFFSKLFPEITWKMSSYYRATHAACTAVNKPNIDRIFNSSQGTISFKPLDWKKFTFSVKACMLDGLTVPPEERYFGTSQDMKLFRYLSDDYNPAEDKEPHRMLHAATTIADGVRDSSSALSQAARGFGQSIDTGTARLERSSALVGYSVCYASKMAEAVAGDAVSAAERMGLLTLVATIFCMGVTTANGEPLLRYELKQLQVQLEHPNKLKRLQPQRLSRRGAPHCQHPRETPTRLLEPATGRWKKGENWLDVNFRKNGHRSELRFELKEKTILSAYEFVTDDYSELRDPAAWRFEFLSEDKENEGNKPSWKPLDVVAPDGVAKLAAFLKQKEEKQEEGVENPNEGDGRGVAMVWYRCYGVE
eukprot:g7891.t1